MKMLFRSVWTILLLVCFACCSGEMAYAWEYENYETYDIPQKEKFDFLQGINFSPLDTEEAENAFSCFAVSPKGQIALCFNGETAFIQVYDSFGQFLYGYRFASGGASLAVFFEGETLSILFAKEQYVGSFDSNGNCLNLQKTRPTKSNSDSYSKDRYRPSTGRVGALQYNAGRIGLSPNYTRFAVVDEGGSQTLIYDATSQMRTRNIVVWVLALSVIVLVLLIRWKNKEAEQYLEKTQDA